MIRYVKHKDGSFSINIFDTTQEPIMLRRFYNYTKFQALRQIVGEKNDGGWVQSAVCIGCNENTRRLC